MYGRQDAFWVNPISSHGVDLQYDLLYFLGFLNFLFSFSFTYWRNTSKIKLFIPQLHGNLKRYTKEEIRKDIILKYASDFSVDVIMEKLMEINPNINPESEETNRLVSRLQSGLESYLISKSI